MNNIFTANRAFTSQVVRICEWGVLILTAIATVVMVNVSPYVGAVMIPLIVSVAEALMDYGRYAGISSKRTSVMSMVRSSSRVVGSLKKALIGDEAAILIRVTAEGGIPLTVMYLCTGEVPVAVALIAGLEISLVMYVMQIIIRLVTRPLSVMVSIYFVIETGLIWLTGVGLGILILYNFETEVTGGVIVTDLIVTGAAVVLGVIFSILNVKLNVRGFLMGYRDSDTE